MTILSTIPASDTQATALAAFITAQQSLATSLAAGQGGNGVHVAAVNVVVRKKQDELIDLLLNSGKVTSNYLLTNASLSYGN